jgi:hypothetical protein
VANGQIDEAVVRKGNEAVLRYRRVKPILPLIYTGTLGISAPLCIHYSDMAYKWSRLCTW